MEEGSKKIPGLVKFLAVLGYIGAGFSIIFGLIFLGTGLFAENTSIGTIANIISAYLQGVPVLLFIILIGILLIFIGVLGIFVSRGLWKGRNWARIFTIVVQIICSIYFLVNIIQGKFGSIISLAVSIAIGSYLWFNKKVKATFQHFYKPDAHKINLGSA